MADQENSAPTEPVKEETPQEVPDAAKTEDPVAETTEPALETASEVKEQEGREL